MKKVAVCLQLYHTDLWPEFEKLLSPLANNIKLYLALCQDNNFTYDLSSFDHHISYHPNYGADVAPFLHQLNLVKEDLFIKVHSKKSKFGKNNQVNWRSILLNDFFASKEIFVSNLEHMLSNKNCGMICNQSFLSGRDIADNTSKINDICNLLNIDYHNLMKPKFAAGTMFLSRTDIFKNKLLKHINVLDGLLKNEKGKVNQISGGTYSHSMERIFGYIISEQGLDFCHPDLKKIKIFNSTAPNKEYFNLITVYDGGCYLVENPNVFGYLKKNTKDIIEINWQHTKNKDLNQPYKRLSEDTIIKANDYDFWRIRNAPNADSIQKMRLLLKSLTYSKHKNILFSIVMPVYNTPANFLVEAIDSVLAQVYPHWELCIADDASSDPHVKDILESYRNKDSRIKVFYSEENKHISHASNLALSMASGEFVVFLDHDDTLSEDALYELFLALNSEKEIDMIYSDEDKIDSNGNYIDPFFKPEWSPDSFLSKMYTCHLSAYRRSIVNELGGLREGFEGSQDWDLMLRFTEKTQKIAHIPKVLYHWRIHNNSTAAAGDAKPYAHIASKKAIDEALVRRGEIGEAVNPYGYNGHYNIRYVIKEHKKVSIIILTKDLGDMLDQCLTSIFTKTIYPNYEVLVIDNNSVEEKTDQVILKWRTKEPNRFKVEKLNIPFNFSAINNYAVSQCDGDYLLFLNNDTEVINNDWLNAMVEQAQRPSIGAVGALLLFSDETIQHAGVIMGLGGVAGHAYYRMVSDMPGYFGNIICQNNVSAVTGACLMCRREVFNQIGGFDETLAVAYNDVDLCLKMLDKGYRNIYIPTAKLYHHESKTRGYEDSPEKKQRLEKESQIIKKKWQNYIYNDPYYSPHLTRVCQNYSIRVR